MHTVDDSSRNERRALSSIAAGMLVSSLSTSSVNAVVPSIASTFGADFRAVQWVVVAYLLAVATTIVGFGRLGDVMGLRRLLEAGLVVLAAASVVGAVAPTLPLEIVARAAQGIGAAAMMAVSAALVTEVASSGRSGSSLGMLGAMSATGTALGPVMGGALAQVFDWRAVLALHAVLAVAVLVAVRRFVPRPASPSRARSGDLDLRGSALLGGALAAYAGFATLARPTSRAGLLLLALAVVLAALFVFAERSSKSPLLRLADLGDGRGEGLFANLVVSAAVMTSLVVGPFHLSRALGLGAGAAGLVLATGPVVAALIGLPAGALVDRFGPRETAFAGLIGVLAGALLMALMPREAGVSGFVVATASMTASYALFQAANGSALLRGVTREQRGVISATLQLSRNVGLMTGATVMGAVFASTAGTVDVALSSADGVAAGTRAAFAVAAALVAVAAAAGLRWRRARASAPRTSFCGG